MNSKIINELGKLTTKTFDLEHILVYSFVKANKIPYQRSKLLNDYMLKGNFDLCEKSYVYFSAITEAFTLETLVELLEYLVMDREKKEKGVVYTPENIKEYMIASAFQTFYAPTVLDPACGCGSFLVTIARQLHTKYNLSYRDIIASKIYGVDVDKAAIRKAKIILELLACLNGEFSDSNYHLICANLLDPKTVAKVKRLCPKGFDCVIGNPPYVRFRNMSDQTKPLLRNWSTSSIGNVDLYMPFFEIGLTVLSCQGILGYITPNSYIQAVNGRKLRSYLMEKNHPISIIDFRDAQMFKGVTSYTCITFIDSGLQESKIQYVRMNDEETLKESIKDHVFSEYHFDSFPKGSPWRMRKSDIDIIIDKLETSGTPLSNWKIRNGLATLKNELYFFTPDYEDEHYYYRTYDGKNYKIEKDICIKAAKPNIIRNEKELEEKVERAIFPYDVKEGVCSILEESVLLQKYPYAYGFLCNYKNVLEKRDKGNGRYPAWYAYGRPQGLNNWGKKLLIPYISRTPTAVLSLDEKLLFYCGYAIISDHEDELRVLKCFLESDAFWYYIYHTSKPYAKGFMSFAKNYLVKFSIPRLTDGEVQYLCSDPPKIELNNWIWNKYGINAQ